MDNTVDVTIPVEPEAAAALSDARNREAVGRLVSRGGSRRDEDLIVLNPWLGVRIMRPADYLGCT